jgi:hypothetical protein
MLVALACQALLTGFALAGIPHAGWLMSHMAERRAKMGLTRLKVDLQCGPNDQALQPEALYIKVPRMVHWKRSDGSSLVCADGKCVRKSPNVKPVRLPDWAFLQFFFFLESAPTGERYMRLLDALKIQTKVDTLTRAGNRVAVVLGAKEWERDRPQIWLDKDRYLPLRLMTLDGQSLMDIQWMDWGSRTAGDWFPARFEVRRDGQLVDHCEVEHVEVNVSMPDELFKLD